jgi:hypothetical protein
MSENELLLRTFCENFAEHKVPLRLNKKRQSETRSAFAVKKEIKQT